MVYFSYRGVTRINLIGIRCLRAESARRVKGKQVQILYDLVTVKGECGAQNVTGESREGSAACEDPKPGNLPYAGTGASAPDHEALVVPSSLRGSCRDKCALPCGGFFPACLF